MKLATTTGDFARHTHSQEDCIRYISEAGFRYADYNFCTDYDRKEGVFASDEDGFVASYAAKIKQAADECGVKLIQAHAPMGRPLLEGDNHAEFVNANIRCIECCSLLGIDRIVVHSGYLPDIPKNECFKRNAAFFRELLPAAEKYGVYILVENFNKMSKANVYWIDNAPDLKRLIKLVDHPLFQAVWDTGHANMQEMPQDVSLRLLGKHVMALHVQDNMGDKDSHVAPFFGTLNLDSLMAGLLDIGYDGYFTFEATNIFLPGKKRRQSDKEKKLLNAPLELRKKAESLLYEIGKTVLEAYGVFEE